MRRAVRGADAVAIVVPDVYNRSANNGIGADDSPNSRNQFDVGVEHVRVPVQQQMVPEHALPEPGRDRH